MFLFAEAMTDSMYDFSSYQVKKSATTGTTQPLQTNVNRLDQLRWIWYFKANILPRLVLLWRSFRVHVESDFDICEFQGTFDRSEVCALGITNVYNQVKKLTNLFNCFTYSAIDQQFLCGDGFLGKVFLTLR